MEEARLDSWFQFIQIANDLHLGTSTAVPYIFRGQSDSSWELEPSLLRELKRKKVNTNQALAIESNALEVFKSQAHLHISANELSCTTDTVSWWTLMQHHGAPTRLLDWSQSIYVAAYFAVIDNLEEDGAIWFSHVHSINKKMNEQYDNYSMPISEGQIKERFLGSDLPNELYVLERKNKSNRMVAQQGLFTVCRNISTSHSDVLPDIIPSIDPGDIYRKIIIPADQKIDFLARLRLMNVTASSLYPGLDGVGKSISELVKLP